MANLRGIVNRVMGSRSGGGAGGRRGGPAGGTTPGTGDGGQRRKDEAVGRGVRGVLSRLRR